MLGVLRSNFMPRHPAISILTISNLVHPQDLKAHYVRFPISLLSSGVVLPSPSISDEPEEAKSFSDSLIPIIPIIPIEELESTILPLLLESYSIDLTTPEKASSLGLPTSTRLGPDVAAAAATLTIPHNGIEQGTTIDMNLLINIITDPELLQKLMNNPPQGNSLSAKSKLAVPSPIPDITGAKLNHPQATVMPFNGSSDGAKSQGPVPRTVTPGHKRKHHQKKCTFYNTSKGCWNGSNCPFRHVPLPTQLQADHLVDEPSVKRIKLNREITGR
ncbi:hypothetical protein SAY87_020304 [Trapa incisa]|uniref:C3H1-type domain-containing protein n=1 Tax=Trapa incisa TaxID=236973 RepID=A0AAN7Q459_9MYRT|nr:hypothetical protein SAY87_020304 [Trapa incisa]